MKLHGMRLAEVGRQEIQNLGKPMVVCETLVFLASVLNSAQASQGEMDQLQIDPSAAKGLLYEP